ncbi:3-ketosteroid-9-alpha-monooxygenase, oxygenase component [BD1-7 clade bacterium]|uniref:cholesterol 7-desaturase n=1 Tax=BD1-7 clade bacterium TaxID=2029982 RepID=A0A5S9QGD9_9GAMM|nr:3-ketosteroid-9-alpha-monooxygenase, oxygenase component [BD1-7 clade bacterium]CAA0117668.1 3-ketosteroid-9-alpha-monooxygenase, oxygenase component [BD1-7 clade bacterium]
MNSRVNILASDLDAADTKRHPFSSYPNGWYIIGTSADVKAGDVKTYRYFGQEIVVFRTKSGELSAVEPYCPHLGAHLGNGHVEGETIVCPFHAWGFAADGRCEHIPYADRIPAKASLKPWHFREQGGLILLYWNREGVAPSGNDAFPVPIEFSTESWSQAKTTTPLEVRTHVQELAENAFDLGHFSGLHGMGYPDVKIDGIDENSMHFTQKMDYRQGGIRLQYEVKLEQCGPNTAISRVTWGSIELILIVTNTPIDEEHIHIRTVVAIKNPASALLREILFRYAFWYTRKELKKDVPIWESKRYHAKPMLCHADGPINTLRDWIQRYY